MRKLKCYQRIKNIVWPRGNFPACLWMLWSSIYTALLGKVWLPNTLDCPSVNTCRWNPPWWLCRSRFGNCWLQQQLREVGGARGGASEELVCWGAGVWSRARAWCWSWGYREQCLEKVGRKFLCFQERENKAPCMAVTSTSDGWWLLSPSVFTSLVGFQRALRLSLLFLHTSPHRWNFQSNLLWEVRKELLLKMLSILQYPLSLPIAKGQLWIMNSQK